jgi:hypothetical protein
LGHQNIISAARLAIDFKTNFVSVEQVPIAKLQSLVNQDAGKGFVLAGWHDPELSNAPDTVQDRLSYLAGDSLGPSSESIEAIRKIIEAEDAAAKCAPAVDKSPTTPHMRLYGLEKANESDPPEKILPVPNHGLETSPGWSVRSIRHR